MANMTTKWEFSTGQIDTSRDRMVSSSRFRLVQCASSRSKLVAVLEKSGEKIKERPG